MKSIVIVLILMLSATLALSEEIELNTVTVGKLKIGIPENIVLKNTHNCKFSKGEKSEWGSDGLYHQTWHSDSCGLELDMVSETENAAQLIASILVTSPSPLATNKGIKIGSHEDEVQAAYKSFINKDESSSHKFIVVGSVYGGIQFSIENNHVKSIFVGASAE